MQLYTVSSKGTLRKAKRIAFTEGGAYIIDDYKNIYVWLGKKTTEKRKNHTTQNANELNSERKPKATIQIMKEGEEFGAFSAMMDLLKKGLEKEEEIERRAELEIEYENTKELLSIGLDPDFEAEITVEAHKLAKKNQSYEELCSILAKLQLQLIQEKENISEKEIKEKASEIYKTSATYEEICWLIAEINKIKKEKF